MEGRRMAIKVGEVRMWLQGLSDEDLIAVDDGGLALVVVGRESYIEVGGIPDEQESDEA